MNNNKLAFVYDLDGTLIDGFLPDDCLYAPLGLDGFEVWGNSVAQAKEQKVDPFLYHLKSFCEIIKAHKPLNMPLNEFFAQNIHLAKFFPGVLDWFEKTCELGRKHNLEIEHFVISACVKGIIKELPCAKHFKAIFASDFILDENQNPYWPSAYINATAKTEFIYRISKGSFEIFETNKVFEKQDKDTRYVKFDNIVYFGDGDTDVPAMKLVKRKGGNAIAVYTDKNQSIVENLLKHNRVNYIAPADYRENSELYSIIKKIIKDREN